MKLILASRSPRRKTLLAMLGAEFEICEADVDEHPLINEMPSDMVLRLATLKATTVYDLYGLSLIHI